MAMRQRLTGVLLVSLSLLGVALLSGVYWLSQSPDAQDRQAPVTPPISLEALITEYPELAQILSDPKIDSVYKEFLVAYETGGENAALELAQQRGLLNADGDLRMTLELDTTNTAPLEVELEANFIEVTAVSGNLMDIAIPVRRLELVMASGSVDALLDNITNLEHVQRIRLPKINIGDAPVWQNTLEPTPAEIAAPAVTETGVGTGVVPLPGGLQMPRNVTLIVLAALLCLVAPALLGLGGFLLLNGLGLIRRGRRDPASIAKSGVTGLDAARRPSGPSSQKTPAGKPATAVRAEFTRESAGPPAAEGRPPTSPPSTPAPKPQAITIPPSQTAVRPGKAAPGPAGRVENGSAASTGLNPAAGAGKDGQSSTCLSCGRVNRSGARFCAACGNDLGSRSSEAAHFEASPGSSEAYGVSQAGPGLPGDAQVDEGPTQHPTFCWNCGQRLRPTSVFCPFCGDRVTG